MAQTGGADGWPWEEKLGRKGPPFSWLFVPGTSFLPFVLALPVSETDGAETDVPETEEGRSRRMSPRRRKAARDGGRPPETDVAEMDVPETEGVFLQALILSDLSECD